MDRVTDVVVVGFGGAGAAAAIEAADAGAEVLVLEKMRRPGGATFMSAGIVYAAGSSVQRSAGITDTPDEMFDYCMAIDSEVRDPALARVLADESAEAVEWLIKLGANFPPEELSFGGAEREYAHVTPPKPRSHHFRALPGEDYFTGSKLFTVLEGAVRARKIEVMLQASAIELITNSGKEVVGVRCQSEGNDIVIRARKAVVLADGGFARNEEMVKQFLSTGPYVAAGKIAMASHPGQTGDGIRMAMALGADLCGMAASHARPLPLVTGRYPSVWVNREGLRFVNENAYLTVTSAALDKQDSVAFQIFDDSVMKEAKIPESGLGRLTSASTIGELATRLEISASRLESTIERWNLHAGSAEDPEFGKKGPAVGPIQTPPFWGGQLRRILEVTYGGLKTNVNAQVLQALHGKPIPRLYAAGQTTGGRLGVYYPGSGSALADCFVFGRIAGKNAAAEITLE